MRFEYDEAISAVRMLIAMPPIVAMRPKRTYHSSDWPGLKYGSTRAGGATVLKALPFDPPPAPRPPRHERRHQARQGDPEHPVGEVLVHQQRDGVVVLQRVRGSQLR